jgi:hypothetical protein
MLTQRLLMALGLLILPYQAYGIEAPSEEAIHLLTSPAQAWSGAWIWQKEATIHAFYFFNHRTAASDDAVKKCADQEAVQQYQDVSAMLTFCSAYVQFTAPPAFIRAAASTWPDRPAEQKLAATSSLQSKHDAQDLISCADRVFVDTSADSSNAGRAIWVADLLSSCEYKLLQRDAYKSIENRFEKFRPRK